MAIQYQRPLDRTFHALGDGTRRHILSILSAEGSKNASELQEPFDVAQPTISKHLKVLEHAGLITRRIEGRTHRFQMADEPLADANQWIERHRMFWEGTLQNLEGYVTKDNHDEKR